MSLPRQRRKVLSEEEYTKNLSEIIEREYYPDLADLQRQVALQDRRAVGDIAGAVAIRRATRQLQEHEESLTEQEKEQEEQAAASGVREVPRPLHRESLSGFHARVTSEDNAEFEQEQRKETQKRRERQDRLLALSNGPCTEPNDRMLTRSSTAAASPLLLASDQFNPSQHRIQHKPATASNGLFFVPSKEDSIVESQEDGPRLLTNTAAVASDSALMPPPASVKKQAATIPKQALVEYVPKDRLEKRIEPSATRFSKRPLIVRPSRDHLEGSGNDGGSTTTECSTDASTDLDAPPRQSLEGERRKGVKRKLREQETLVQMTPLIVPGQGGSTSSDDVNASPIVTWGAVSSTPMVLGQAGDTDSRSFRLPEESERERAAKKAQAKLEERARRAASASRVPVGARTASLTPAAMSLLQKTSRPPSVRSGSALASALRSSYTLKRAASSSRRSARRDAAYAATPRIDSGKGSATKKASSSGENVTDGLLKL